MEALRSLPYAAWSPPVADNREGVTISRPDLYFDGYNLYTHGERAVLLDMKGQPAHTWKSGTWGIHAVNIASDGSAFWIANEQELWKVTADSKLVWSIKGRFHHEIELLEDGSILTARRKRYGYNYRIVIFDEIVRISPEGVVEETIPLFALLPDLKKTHPPDPILDNQSEMHDPKHDYDYYHLNSIQSLPETPLGRADARFAKGNLLVSLRNKDLIAILAPDSGSVLWSWGPGQIVRQHAPRMLPDGNILIFDNGETRRYSRVIELNPVTSEIVWEYRAPDFYSWTRGYAQRLPNGNTLVSDSDNGRAFEIDSGGEIVWEFWNPIDPKKNARRPIYRMTRLTKEQVASLVLPSEPRERHSD